MQGAAGPGHRGTEKASCAHPDLAPEQGQACLPLWHISPGRVQAQGTSQHPWGSREKPWWGRSSINLTLGT